MKLDCAESYSGKEKSFGREFSIIVISKVVHPQAAGGDDARFWDNRLNSSAGLEGPHSPTDAWVVVGQTCWLPSPPNVTKVQLPYLYLRNLDKAWRCATVEPEAAPRPLRTRVLTRPRAR
jgi:hypothetical protein